MFKFNKRPFITTLTTSRGLLVGQVPDYNGTAITYTTTSAGDVTNGHEFINNDSAFRNILHCKNTTAGAIVVTIDIPSTSNINGHYPAASFTVSVPATTGDIMIADFPTGTFNQAAEETSLAAAPGYVRIDTDVLGLKIALIKVALAQPQA